MTFCHLHLTLLLFCSVLIPAQGFAQSGATYRHSETGLPLIRNYNSLEYQAAPQNLALVQDSCGIFYIANNSSNLLEFDGITWRQINLPKDLGARSLASDEKGRVYVGGQGISVF